MYSFSKPNYNKIWCPLPSFTAGLFALINFRKMQFRPHVFVRYNVYAIYSFSKPNYIKIWCPLSRFTALYLLYFCSVITFSFLLCFSSKIILSIETSILHNYIQISHHDRQASLGRILSRIQSRNYSVHLFFQRGFR